MEIRQQDDKSNYQKQNDDTEISRDLNQNSIKIDGHIHSVASPDGFLTIDRIISQAQQSDMSYIAITDHNTCSSIDNYMRINGLTDEQIYIDVNGLKVVCGAEVTCFFTHSNKTTQNLHILCYGFNRNPNNAFMSLINAKYKDYLETFFTIPETLAKVDGIYEQAYDMNEFKYFIMKQRVEKHLNTHSGFNYKEVISYFEHKGIPATKVKSDIQNYRNLFKLTDKITLDFEEVIDAVHSAGGKCIIAHPVISYKKYMSKYKLNDAQKWQYIKSMTDTLLDLGVDGVELHHVFTDGHIYQRFNKRYSKLAFTSYGSDIHDNISAFVKIGQAPLLAQVPTINFAENIEQLQLNQYKQEKVSNIETYQNTEDNAIKIIAPERGL